MTIGLNGGIEGRDLLPRPDRVKSVAQRAGGLAERRDNSDPLSRNDREDRDDEGQQGEPCCDAGDVLAVVGGTGGIAGCPVLRLCDVDERRECDDREDQESHKCM